MKTVVPFERWHLSSMVHQEHQKGLKGLDGLENLKTDSLFAALEGTYSYTLIIDGEIMCCAGMIEMTKGRGIAWAYLAADIKHRMATVTRTVKEYMKAVPFHRIEMHVDCEFPEAHRWARMLGFNMECERMVAFTPDKRDCALYAMVKL